MSARPASPGDRLLHPLALCAVGLMAVNDHVLKVHWSGVLSGKLSDVAGLVVLSLTLFSLAEVISRRLLGRRALWAAMATSAVGYSLVEVWAPAEWAWCVAWGLFQWPFRALYYGVTDGVLVTVAPVAAWSDWTDLLVLPATFLVLLAARAPNTSATGQASPTSS